MTYSLIEQITYITGATATHFVAPNAKTDTAGTRDGAEVMDDANAGETFPTTATNDAINAKADFMNLGV